MADVNEEGEEPKGELADLVSEIDAAVEAATKSVHEGTDEVEPEADDVEEAPADKAEARDGKGRFTAKGDKPEAAVGLSEAALERAVKAGFTLAEAKQFPNDTLLGAMCDRVEGGAKASGSQNGAGDKGSPKAEAQPGEEEDPWSKIQDLDPNVFDERIVDFVKVTKAQGAKQFAELKALRGDKSKGWLATKLDGVKNLTKGDASKEAAVREKFEVLGAGYKAAGKAVTDEAIFSEASQLVLGGDMVAAEKQKKSEAAKKRNGQIIQRTTGRRAEPRADADAEIAELIDAKFPRS